jgi:F-type H+-transporting ATPase subunit gamma
MRFAEIESPIVNIGEWRDIIGAMRSLAGIRVQEAQHALQAVRRDEQTVADAIGDALPLVPESPPAVHAGLGRRGFVLSIVEHGIVGGFNERLFAAASGSPPPAGSPPRWRR